MEHEHERETNGVDEPESDKPSGCVAKSGSATVF